MRIVGMGALVVANVEINNKEFEAINYICHKENINEMIDETTFNAFLAHLDIFKSITGDSFDYIKFRLNTG